jgi:hypothetical protein
MKLRFCTASISEVIWPVTGFGESGIVSVGGGPFDCVVWRMEGQKQRALRGAFGRPLQVQGIAHRHYVPLLFIVVTCHFIKEPGKVRFVLLLILIYHPLDSQISSRSLRGSYKATVHCQQFHYAGSSGSTDIVSITQ